MSEKKSMLVDPSIGDKLEAWCNEPPSDAGKGEVLFDESVKFSDGCTMAIQAIASLDPDSSPIWTQGVLFTKEGLEAGCTDVGDSFYGEYQVDNYICLVDPTST